jgi:hypothetical protein
MLCIDGDLGRLCIGSGYIEFNDHVLICRADKQTYIPYESSVA